MGNLEFWPKEDGGGKEDKDKRLPMFGPLAIEDMQVFYTTARERFHMLYEHPNYDIVTKEEFSVLKLLGKGAFGKVFLVRNKAKSSTLYAMKAIEKRLTMKTKQVTHVLNEKRVLQSVDFPFGVRLECFSKDNTYIYFFMPYVPGGELYAHIKHQGAFDERTSTFFAAQVVLGLEYLHKMKLVYRDMKPENLLLDCHGYLRITDYGFSKVVLNRTFTFCGTPHYLAPEVIQGHGHGLAVDWWGLGVLIYEMNAGYPPFDARSDIVLFKSITKGRYVMPLSFNNSLRDIIRKLLEPDLSKRYGNLKEGPTDIKKHEWFKDINWMEVFNRKVKSPLVPTCRHLSDNVNDQRTVTSGLAVSEANEFEEEFKNF